MFLNYENLRPILIELAEYEPNRDYVDFDKFMIQAKRIEGVMALDDFDKLCLKYDFHVLSFVIYLLILMAKYNLDHKKEIKQHDYLKGSRYLNTLINEHTSLVEFYKTIDDKKQIISLEKYKKTLISLKNNPSEVLLDLNYYYFADKAIKKEPKKVKSFLHYHSNYLHVSDKEDIQAYANFFKLFVPTTITTTKIVKTTFINIVHLYKKHSKKKVPMRLFKELKNTVTENTKINFSKMDQFYLESHYRNFPILEYGTDKSPVIEMLRNAQYNFASLAHIRTKQKGKPFDLARKKYEIDQDLEKFEKSHYLFLTDLEKFAN